MRDIQRQIPNSQIMVTNLFFIIAKVHAAPKKVVAKKAAPKTVKKTASKKVASKKTKAAKKNASGKKGPSTPTTQPTWGSFHTAEMHWCATSVM